MPNISTFLNESTNSPSEEQIQASIAEAKIRAEKFRSEPFSSKWKDATNGWKFNDSNRFTDPEKTIDYHFVKNFPHLVEVSFKDKWGHEQFGYAYSVRISRTHAKVKGRYVWEFSASFSCVAAQIKGSFYKGEVNIANFERTCTKAYYAWFKKNGIDLTWPDVNNEQLYPRK